MLRNTLLPAQKDVLTSVENKRQLIRIIFDELTNDEQFHLASISKHKSVVTGETLCPVEINQNRTVFRHDLESHHEEADVIIVQQFLSRSDEVGSPWCQTINKTKTELILIDFPSLCTNNFTLNLDNFEIPRVKTTEFLGTIIDEQLKFDVHIDNLVRSLRKFIPPFYKIQDMMPLNILLMLHEQLRLSKIRYCLIVFGSSNKTTK